MAQDAKNSENIHDDDDDLDDDELLNFDFRKVKKGEGGHTSLRKETKAEEKIAASASTAEADIEAAASKKARLAPIHARINACSELYWHRYNNRKKVEYYPCRSCNADEVVGLDLPKTWDATQKQLVQYIDFLSMGDRQLVSRRALIPYCGEERNSGDKGNWCPELCAVYTKQRKQQKKHSETDSRAEVLFLERILGRAREEENKDNEHELFSDMAPSLPEEPSNQNIESSEDSDDEDHEHCAAMQSGKIHGKKEPIRPGDIIQYYTHIYVAGDKRGLKNAEVISVDRTRNPVLVLDNGDHLQIDRQVKRIKVKVRGRLKDHDGIFRKIEEFQLRTLGSKKADGSSDVAAGIRKEAERLGKMLQDGSSKLQAKIEADGFAPVDLLNKYRGVGQTDSPSERGPTKSLRETLPRSPHTYSKPPAGDNESKSPPKSSIKRSRSETQRADWANPRRRSRQAAHITNDQLQLASQVKLAMQRRWVGDGEVELESDHIPEEGLAALEDELKIPKDRIKSFLLGDPHQLYTKAKHEETENLLRQWVSSETKIVTQDSD